MALTFLGGRRIVLAPMAGGPGTAALAAAVAAGGGFPVLPSGYVSADTLAETVRAFREQSAAAYAVNLFVPAAPDEARLAAARAYAEQVHRWARDRDLPVGEPRHDDDDFAAKVDLLLREPPAAATFAFGLPDDEVVRQLAARGVPSLVTVTSPAEAAAAAERGVEGLVVQGEEAGSHRGGWLADGEPVPLLPLLARVREVTDLPLLAAGGVATGERVVAALDAGAEAVVVGTAFLLTPQAGTSPVHRHALTEHRATVLTRAFTGKPARALRNAFTDAFGDDAPDAYPEVHHVTAVMRAAARERGDAEAVNLWAGRGYAHAPAESADVVVRRLLRAAGLRDPEGLLVLLREQWAALRSWLDEVGVVGRRATPTALEGWTVGHLVAHLGLGLRLLVGVEAAPTDAVPLTFREYVAAYPPAADAIDAMTRELATSMADDLLGGIDEIAAEAWAAWESHDDPVVLGRRGAIRRDDYVLTRLLELVVHADDLDRALGHPRPTHPALPAAVAAVAEALAAAYEEAAGTPWTVDDPLTWIRLATGRRPSDDPTLPLL